MRDEWKGAGKSITWKGGSLVLIRECTTWLTGDIQQAAYNTHTHAAMHHLQNAAQLRVPPSELGKALVRESVGGYFNPWIDNKFPDYVSANGSRPRAYFSNYEFLWGRKPPAQPGVPGPKEEQHRNHQTEEEEHTNNILSALGRAYFLNSVCRKDVQKFKDSAIDSGKVTRSA